MARSSKAAISTLHPHSWVGKSGPSTTDIVPTFYKERPSSVTVLGKKISSDAVVTVNAQAQFHPIPISFEAAKPKQHFQRSRQLQDISNQCRPRTIASCGESVGNSKLLNKIKNSAQPDSFARESGQETKPTKKPRPPKAPRSGKSKAQKKAAVPQLAAEAKAPKRESPNIKLLPKIEEIVHQSLKRTHEDKLREEEERITRQLEELKKRELLKQQNLKIRLENKRFQAIQFRPRVAWGTDERKIYGTEKSRSDARQEREDRLAKQQRAKSVGKDRIGTDALNEIKAELRRESRSQSVISRQAHPRKERAYVPEEVRRPDPSIQGYIKGKKQEIKDLQERECISQLAMEAKRLSQLKELDAKAKVAIQKFKKRRRKASKRRNFPDLVLSDSNTLNPEDDEVDVIMNRFQKVDQNPDKEQGRESRIFGVMNIQAPLTEEQGNATQDFQSELKYDGSDKPRNMTAPVDFGAGFHSSHTDLNLPIDSQASLDPFIESAEDSELEKEDEPSLLHLSEISKRKEDIRKKVADLRRRADEVQVKVREEVSESPWKSEDKLDTPLNLPLMRVADFEIMMQEQAAIKIQSHIRRFLAISRFEILKEDLLTHDLSFYSDDISPQEPKQSKLTDRLRIGVRGGWAESNDSEPDLLESSGEQHLDYPDDEDVHQPTSEPYRRPHIDIDSDETDDLEELLEQSRPENPDNEDFEYEEEGMSSQDENYEGEDSQGEVQDLLLQELQNMKDREHALEDMIDQHNSRQLAEEARKSQIKNDLEKLRDYDRSMLEEVAARSGASMLTELLSKLFDQRYKRLEELFKGNRDALQEAISGDLPYFEQLEQCLKNAEDAKRSGRGEATSIDNLLDHLIDNTAKPEQLDNYSSSSNAGSVEYHGFSEVPANDSEKKRKFEEDIRQLEQELYPTPPSERRSDRHILSRQPFSGLLAGYSDQRSDDLEQHISDLSADIEGSEEGSPQVRSQPFDIVNVYISTEEALETQQSLLEVDSANFPVNSNPTSRSSTSLAELQGLDFSSPSPPKEFPKSIEASVSNSPDRGGLVDVSLEEGKYGFGEDSVSEANRTQVDLAGEALVDEIFELLVVETLEILEEDEVEEEEFDTNPHFQFPFKPVEDLNSQGFKFPYKPEVPSLVNPNVSNESRVPRYQTTDQDTPEPEVNLSEFNSPSPKRDKPSEVSNHEVAALLTEEIMADLLRAELSEIPPPKTPRQILGMPQLPIDTMSPQREAPASGSGDFALKTDTAAVLAYTDEVFKYSFHVQRDLIEADLSKALPTDPKQVLQQLQDQDLTSFTGRVSLNTPAIINIELYIEIEKARNAIASNRTLLSPNTAQADSEASNIHNKMIFDCINEALAKHLPYGTKGSPMPWSFNIRTLAPAKVDVPQVLGEVKETIRKWSSIQAGKLPSLDMFFSSGRIDEDYLQHVRAERLDACVTLELMENDREWIDYEHEETQVKLDLADIVLDQLMAEAFNLLQSVNSA